MHSIQKKKENYKRECSETWSSRHNPHFLFLEAIIINNLLLTIVTNKPLSWKSGENFCFFWTSVNQNLHKNKEEHCCSLGPCWQRQFRNWWGQFWRVVRTAWREKRHLLCMIKVLEKKANTSCGSWKSITKADNEWEFEMLFTKRRNTSGVQVFLNKCILKPNVSEHSSDVLTQVHKNV